LGSKQAVLAPPATPPRYSLLSVATAIVNNETWEQGIRWNPEQVLGDGSGVVSLDCIGGTDAMDKGTNPDWTEADPFSVWAEDHCSTLGFRVADYEGRARRQLEAVQSYQIANELWLGTLAQSASLDNHWLTEDPAIIDSGTALSPLEALAAIDMGLGQWLGGRKGMIHVTTQILAELHAIFALELQGQVWVTPQGTPVVADAGYPGTRPDANNTSTHQWIYGTPNITYRLGEPQIVPDPNAPGALAARTDRAVNTITLYAQRLALLQWDSELPIGSSGKRGVLAVETTTAAWTAL
jgi:hypothetical protein